MISKIPKPLQAKQLPTSFFERDTVTVARELLGCQLWRFWPEIGEWLNFTIVETEAYTADDPACHAYNRRTGRAAMLYEAPGTAYVYLIYGMYDCLNVVTEPRGSAGAVLFRALEPPVGTAFTTNGPGRLTKALNIRRADFNGKPMTCMSSGLFLAEGTPLSESSVIQTTRIGITKARDYPWRFYVKESRWVSVRAKEHHALPSSRSRQSLSQSV
ncbi:MAG TPA: DNA-3-methyladenine glycosylase [Oculatellaceae cyanobacterium]